MFQLNLLPLSASIPYEAYLEKGSDPDFRVYPTNGQLLPLGTEGTLICVAYKPTLYGKTHNAKLIVQVNSLPWRLSITAQKIAAELENKIENRINFI